MPPILYYPLFSGFLWSAVCIFIHAPSGRQRFNVLGALNAVTHEMVTITNDTYTTAQSVCALLERLQRFTRVYRSPSSWMMPATSGFPWFWRKPKASTSNFASCLPYYPNLNLIEQVWKFVNEEVSVLAHYEKLPAFKAAISECLQEARTTHKAELDSLLTLRFQLFQKTAICDRVRYIIIWNPI
jgi:hypothetical protein